jgi:hypothetical protein
VVRVEMTNQKDFETTFFKDVFQFFLIKDLFMAVNLEYMSTVLADSRIQGFFIGRGTEYYSLFI